MRNSDYKIKVEEMCDYVNGCTPDNIRKELIERGITNPLLYGNWCERNFEANLNGYERKTTYTADFSIAEWCVPFEGMTAISDTLSDALLSWKDDIEFMAELIVVFCMKSWEHAARGNNNYGKMYSDLYLKMKDLFFDWFDESNPQHDEAMQYYFDYVD